MIANYSAEIKIEIFQSVSERQGDDCSQTAAKIAHFNSVNSETIGWKFTKAGLLPFNVLKADLQSANPL